MNGNLSLFPDLVPIKPFKIKRMISVKPVKMVKPVKVEEPKEDRGISFSLTQSLLQKSVRQCQPEIAVRAAKEMIIQDAPKMLRRLIVIMVEDCLMHPKISEIGKLYTSSQRKSFILTDEDKDLIINVVYEIAECKQLDIFPERLIRIANPEKNEAFDNRFQYIPKLEELNEPEFHFLKGIEVRMYAGGMEGDVAMLKNYYYLWLKRFATGEWDLSTIQKYFTESHKSFNEVKKLEVKDILLEAADFHCTPMLKILLRKDYIKCLMMSLANDFQADDQKLSDMLGDLLWRQHSWRNFKIELDTGRVRDWYEKEEGKLADKVEETKIYDRIKEDVYGIAKWWISKTVTL